MKSLITVIIIIASFAFLFAGCDLPDSADEEIAVAIITILPSDGAASGYHLAVTKDGDQVYSETYPSDQNIIELELTAGDHDFTLDALTEVMVIAKGNASVSLTAGINTVEITLASVFIYEINNILPFLETHDYGTGTDDPVDLFLQLELNTANWNRILNILDIAGRYVSLNLSEIGRAHV